MNSEQPQFTVRALEPGDAAAVTLLNNHPHNLDESVQIPYKSVSEVARAIANSPNGRRLVAEASGAIAGTGHLHLFEGRRAHAARIEVSVDPDRGGVDIRRVLLQELIDLGEKWLGIQRFELLVFSDSDLITIYEGFGFEIETTHREYALRDGAYADAHTMARLR